MKKDSIGLGIVIGVVAPVALYGLAYLLLLWKWERHITGMEENLTLFCLAINAVLVKQLMFKYERDETGKGIIAVSLIMAIIWMAMFKL